MVHEDLFSIAVFPYLKTSRTVPLGPYLFRSTTDTDGLSEAQSTAVSEVTAMLYAQNSLRVRSASYALIPPIHISGLLQIPETLKRVHILVAYLYGIPLQEFVNTYLTLESATLLIFTPSRVPRFLVEPENHTILDEPLGIAWDGDHAPGYDGMLNLSEPFWVVKGARVYPPVPHITLNIHQDLATDCSQFKETGTGNELMRLLVDEHRHVGEKIFTALSWYNATTRTGVSESEALVKLAIAFESLLNLPASEKTNRFVDSVSLLLGRVPRLEDWIKQFYEARSRVAHEGRLAKSRFMVPQPGKPSQHIEYHPLLVFGREIFRLCVAAITHGAYLAESHDLTARLTTNSERFQEICRLLDTGSMSDNAQAIKIQRLVGEINLYRFVGESGLSIGLVLGAVQKAVKDLLKLDKPLAILDEAKLSTFAKANTKDVSAALELLMSLQPQPLSAHMAGTAEPELIVSNLLAAAWMHTFQAYLRLKSKI